MVLRNDSVFALVKSLNSDSASSKRLAVSGLDDVALYRMTTDELPIFFRAADNSVKAYKVSSLLRSYTLQQR